MLQSKAFSVLIVCKLKKKRILVYLELKIIILVLSMMRKFSNIDSQMYYLFEIYIAKCITCLEIFMLSNLPL